MWGRQTTTRAGSIGLIGTQRTELPVQSQPLLFALMALFGFGTGQL
jgi:hypothetical protein